MNSGRNRTALRAKLLRVGRRGLLALAVLLAALLAAAATLHLAFPFPMGKLAEAGRGGSALVLDRDGRPLAWRVGSTDEFRLPVPLSRISPWLVRATLAAEDRRFRSHCGVDPLAAARAVAQNLSSGRRVSGASTLTMQTVRLLWPRPRTWTAKAVEAFRALQLERAADKDRILEAYLNLAPYGGNVVGAEAAARLCFGKGAEELTLGEAALLAGVPQSPARLNPRRHPEAALERREYVLARMLELGLASHAEVERARREPVRMAMAEGPREASDAPGGQDAAVADWLVGRLGRDCGAVRSTLDARIQAAARTAAERHAAGLRGRGVDALAVVVIDVRRSELAAMVACSGDSQVNGALAPRQPGSLLKPFVYARAFDLGLLAPDSVVYDLPGRWGGYQPENFDREFLGPMSAARALAESRNLPAVRTLAATGSGSLARDLAALGVPLARPADSYGLSLALGSAEVRLTDVTNAYAALARLGRWRSLKLLRDAPDGEERRVFSQGASYLALRCLGASTGEGRHPACKTGTSWNFRDAWAVAVTPDYAVGVWCGRLSGAGNPSLVGARAALPLALELAEALPASTWGRPEAVRVRRVCALSGAPPTACCPHAVEAEYLPGVSSEPPCRLHRASGGAVVESWPAEFAVFLKTKTDRDGRGRQETAGDEPGPLHIVSPRTGTEYVLTRGEERDLRLSALASRDGGPVWWFVDGRLLGRTAAGGNISWSMSPGAHEVLACDASGRSSAVRFSVAAGIPAGGRRVGPERFAGAAR